MKTTLLAIIGLGALVAGVWWLQSPGNNDPDIVAYHGLHWHPQLTIYVKGVLQEIPANIGIGREYADTPGYDPQMQMAAIHTHEDPPLLHLEFMGGLVRKKDITLGQFFKIWGRDIRSFGTNVRMTVNGTENTEYENYPMRDGDVIELQYD